MKHEIAAERLDPKRQDQMAAVAHIICNLRPEELHELAAVGLDRGAMAKMIAFGAMTGEAYLLHYRDEPVFVWGVSPSYRGLYSLWGFGTPLTRRAMPAITRWGMGTWLPDFAKRTSARRIEVRVPVSSVHSINWLRSLGMEIETRLPNYGVTGEDFFQLALSFPKLKDIPAHVLSSSSSSAACSAGAD